MHHINVLELTAGTFAVKTFAQHRKNIDMHLKMHNKTAILYINKMGELNHISLPTQLASCSSGASSGGSHYQQNICLGPATS